MHRAEALASSVNSQLCWCGSLRNHATHQIHRRQDWQTKISRAGHSALNAVKIGPWDHSRWDDILDQSSKFCQESELALEPERHDFLDKVMSIVRSVELQSHVRIRLCMLGTSCVLLPRKLDRMLSTEECLYWNHNLLSKD